MKAFKKALQKLAEAKRFRPEKRPLLEEAFHLITSSENPPFLILQAPTGYGKTLLSFALTVHSLRDASIFDRVIHVLPMRSIIEDIQKTADEAFGFSRTKMMGSSGEFLHLFPLNITTADTFTRDLLKLNTKKRHRIKAGREFGYDYLTQASILTSLVIFDEAHFLLEDASMVTAFLAIVEFLTSQKIPIVVMTATLSEAHGKIFEKYAKKNGYDFHVLSPKEDDPFIERELKKDIEIMFDSGNPLNFIEPGKKNAIIVNSVKRAVELFNKARNNPDIWPEGRRIMLIHGRMTPSHKRELIKRLREWKNEGNFLLIGTQAVEAGVDFSVDLMVTDRAPINSLLQRFGRVARYGSEMKAEIIVLEDAPCGPYLGDKVERTVKLMKEHQILPRVPDTYQAIVTEVHGKKPVSITRNVNRELKGRLFRLMVDPTKRAPQVLSTIESLTASGTPIMRGFLIPLSVGDEAVLITPSKLVELYSKRRVEINGWKGGIQSLKDAYNIAKSIALGEEVDVVFMGEYDWERGIP
ncbi:CRISPR-associated helicase Cas3 [Thermococcus celericrescens]|uniref:CRISPR-associated helicase Cas3 n=1 Tax=Thermococcus celericrescens TaxID=227598 RepID=A0A100XX77_9EURY|nr:CRISPR-associated helicase Cas3' [Thermococcus celericrescens]KUH32858.1 CRISPR-associated helicase Cas3 [Thermococcus celericrescens]